MSRPLQPLSAETLAFLTPYLPPKDSSSATPHITLTYAQTLDSSLSLPGKQIALSSPQTKVLTHHLRLHHDTILVGVTTANVDDPGLNSRIEGATLEQQPRPIILDPRGRWNGHSGSRVIQTAKRGEGKAPWVVTGELQGRPTWVEALEQVGGRWLQVPLEEDSRWTWSGLKKAFGKEGVTSVMVEGGAAVIDGILREEGETGGIVDSLIVTVCPGFLGGEAVRVGPKFTGGRGLKTKDSAWGIVGNDAVLASRVGGEF
ncbi:hypothetical protein BJ508DRAFT_244847 [Ascobolus immersus RN42]|uniref:2,5-diamino-6-ribosylamino-4(3H)-pyrimidinone 5'-phosphate reductase n=1 Tax=Ascobolus immersus RN42 TaxID=1160509 RepID=A0A3N4HI94_ASCIM|nr:hypothetical protein BJ508DRAFT_244847 [Ascobolus immersus RN42]